MAAASGRRGEASEPAGEAKQDAMGKRKPTKKRRAVKRKEKPQAPSLPPDLAAALRSMEPLFAEFENAGRTRKKDPLDTAQELIYDAWEAPTRRQAVALAKKALEVCPDCADAYSLLAERGAQSPAEGLELYRQALEAAERTLGERVFAEDAGHFWLMVSTRPYMRARKGLAMCLWRAGRREEAVEHYWDLLRLNPNDNQGVRDLLMPCLIELGRDEDAERLYRQYENDCFAVWAYSRALLDFRRHGDSVIAVRSLAEALETNRHVPAYLLGRRKPPRSLPDYYSPGEENEAIIYVYDNLGAWQASPGALEWLARETQRGAQ